MTTYTDSQIALFREEGLLETAGAWAFQGIDCDIISTGGGIYCLVAELPNGMTAVRGEYGFTIFTNEEWNEWIAETEHIAGDDYQSQVNWIRIVQDGSFSWTITG